MTPGVDARSLTRVPQAASRDNRQRDVFAAALFAIAIATMGLGAFRPRANAALDAENRTILAWPAPAFTRAYASNFERAFADRFAGRDALLRIHNRTLVRAFGVSPAQNVLIGRDGWLYFLGEEGTSFDRFYRGAPGMTDAQVGLILAELKRRERFLASHRIAYVVTIAPDKETIYPEHLPRWAVQSAQRTPLDRLTEAIRADGTLRYVDLRAPLRAAKAHERVYYATDSHWNFLGAAVAYREIMRAVSEALPTKNVSIAPVVMPPYTPGVDVYRGDLARMTGDIGHFGEPDYAPLGKILATPQSRCGKRIDAGNSVAYEWFGCNRPGLPQAVVYRDSMAIPLIPMLSENFSRVAYVSSHLIDAAFVLRERPDVVIEEMVERAMLSPVATPMPEPEPDR